MMEAKREPVSVSAINDHFTLDELLAANAQTEWADLDSLIPFEQGQIVVERIGDVRYLSVIDRFDDDTVRTRRGFFYTRDGVGLTIDGTHRSLTSPYYHIKRLSARAEAA